jgi:hypothetical protein
MVLPLVPLLIVIGSAVTGAGGAAGGVWGGVQIRRAKADMKSQTADYEVRYAAHRAKVEETNTVLQRLGLVQERAQTEVIFRMRDFLVRHAKRVRAQEHLILDGVDGSNRPVVGLTKLDPDLAGWVRGVVGSTIVGIATPVAIRTGVVSFATASTGTAIAGLSGAAAVNATLAWLGGGALAAGGGGMALGAVMLNVAIAGPTVLIAGISVKNRGTKAKTEAEKHRTDVRIAIAQLHAREELLRAVRSRAVEVEAILTRLVSEAGTALDLLESEIFNQEEHVERLQRSLVLVKSVRDVATAPISDEDGTLNEQTEDLVVTYRAMGKEKVNG